MNHIAYLAKTKIGLDIRGESEEGYEHRKRFVKGLCDTTDVVQRAVAQVEESFDDFVASLSRLYASFAELDRIVSFGVVGVNLSTSTFQKHHSAASANERDGISSGLEGTVLSTIIRQASQHLEEFRAQEVRAVKECLQYEVVAPLKVLEEQQKTVDELRTTRQRRFEAFDRCRIDVVAKEKEYEKSRKPLSESKQYPALLQAMEVAKENFESAVDYFNAGCDELVSDAQCFSAQCFQAGIHRSILLLEGLSERLRKVFDETTK